MELGLHCWDGVYLFSLSTLVRLFLITRHLECVLAAYIESLRTERRCLNRLGGKLLLPAVGRNLGVSDIVLESLGLTRMFMLLWLHPVAWLLGFILNRSFCVALAGHNLQTRSLYVDQYVDQAGPKFMVIVLPVPPEGWNCGCAPPCLAGVFA